MMMPAPCFRIRLLYSRGHGRLYKARRRIRIRVPHCRSQIEYPSHRLPDPRGDEPEERNGWSMAGGELR